MNKYHLLLGLSFLSFPILGKYHTVSILGTGYVGLVTGTCLADMHEDNTITVFCLDIDTQKIENLKKGIIPIYEPGLATLVQKNQARNTLFFSDTIPQAVSQSDIIFIAVGTPAAADGSADLSYFYNALEQTVKNIRCNPTTLVLKSTLPIGTVQKVREIINAHIDPFLTVHVISNPEFLREGTAIHDTMHPDRIILGSDTNGACAALHDLYQPLIRNDIPILHTDLASAETIKYASNNFLAVKISFINEIANLCDKTGANITDVAKGIGMDKRIGHSFLKPGPGFGGSCLPKDTQGLLATAQALGIALPTIEAALKTNEYQQLMPYRKLKQFIPSTELANKKIALFGLAFKANTDDIRYSAAIPIIRKLQEKGAHISAYDPQAMHHMKTLFPDITYSDSAYEATRNADALLILTEWDEFKEFEYERIKKRGKNIVIIDSRNIIDSTRFTTLDFKYSGLASHKKAIK